MKQNNLKLIDFKVAITVFDDWRDWFVVEKDPVHETNSQFYIEEFLVGERKVPINFKKINFSAKIKSYQKTIVSHLSVRIPEMNIFRTKTFDRDISVSLGDTLHIDYDLIIEK